MWIYIEETVYPYFLNQAHLGLGMSTIINVEASISNRFDIEQIRYRTDSISKGFDIEPKRKRSGLIVSDSKNN